MIRKRSKKRAKQERDYSKLRIEFLTENPFCQAKIQVACTGSSTDVHHKRGRTGNLLIEVKYWLAVCRNCHSVIELNPAWAKEQGFSESRLANNDVSPN